jgi:hypothetical protein
MRGGGKDGDNVRAIYSVLWVLLGQFTACSATGGGETGKGGEKDRERRGRKGGKGDRQQRVRGRKTAAQTRAAPGTRLVQNICKHA